MLYFAYGSNMDWVQIRERCPSAQFMSVAKLPDHRLAFTRKSETRKCGVADAVPEKGANVWGVVYQIDEVDVGRLDQSEGFRPGRANNSYAREERHVFGDGDKTKPVAVSIYFAQREKNPPPPNAPYKRVILEGARFWHLPEDYIAELEKIDIAS
jgi:gamma-glutamylcyclotransferase